jgi:hypothetical protein
MPIQLDRPLELADWQAMFRAMDGDATTFHAHATAFAGNDITEELQCVLAHFGDRCARAVYAVRNGTIEAVWIDAHHNYVAIVCTKASGDPEDCVLIQSIGGPALVN